MGWFEVQRSPQMQVEECRDATEWDVFKVREASNAQEAVKAAADGEPGCYRARREEEMGGIRLLPRHRRRHRPPRGIAARTELPSRDTARAMSEENVELVLKDLEYWNRGDMDAFVGLWDDDVVLVAAEGWPERVFRGKDAVRSFYEGFAETVGRDSMIEDLIDAGDVVVTRMRAHMTGVQSGLEGDMRFSQVTTFRKGKVVRAEFFWDHQEALEAAGLRE